MIKGEKEVEDGGPGLRADRKAETLLGFVKVVI
jgi:hypothetical protein